MFQRVLSRFCKILDCLLKITSSTPMMCQHCVNSTQVIWISAADIKVNISILHCSLITVCVQIGFFLVHNLGHFFRFVWNNFPNCVTENVKFEAYGIIKFKRGVNKMFNWILKRGVNWRFNRIYFILPNKATGNFDK